MVLINIMETTTFDDQIFGDFTGPLSPLGPKAHSQQSGHSIQVMLGMSQHPQSGDTMCNSQRLPEVHSLLPGSPKLADHYKNLDYGNTKMDYNNGSKIGSYSPSSTKYDYGPSCKLSHYSSSPKIIDYGKPMDYNSNGKLEYASPSNKLDYEQMQMFQQPQQQPMDVQMVNGKKKPDEPSTTSSPNSVVTSDATSTGSSKKGDKKKGDPNGVKKKKTRYVCAIYGID